MEPDIPPAPPEAILIRVAREATGMNATQAAHSAKVAQSAKAVLSAAYWRDVERGYGYRRGARVPAKASARVLAHMARAVHLSPERLESEGRRPDAAAVLAEIIRDDALPPRVHYAEEPDWDEAWERYPRDPVKRWLWRTPGATEAERIRLIATLDEERRRARDDPREQAG